MQSINPLSIYSNLVHVGKWHVQMNQRVLQLKNNRVMQVQSNTNEINYQNNTARNSLKKIEKWLFETAKETCFKSEAISSSNFINNIVSQFQAVLFITGHGNNDGFLFTDEKGQNEMLEF